MGSQNLCIAHENIFNKSILDEDALYFRDSDKLSIILDEIMINKNLYIKNNMKDNLFKKAKTLFSWDLIAKSTLIFLMTLLKKII